ncbi:nucleoside deaminase [Corynebacterium glyciniphilum]|uniref:nucleoside deaminase n=1 Tax=Corynebacterium glyciniphilum TaxID=1404244 RepID=UPI0011AB6800|nr:nucleoside deaminase [Corynebacterium glyciniphilum]
MNTDTRNLTDLMAQAVDTCTAHVEAGGLPFIGVLVNPAGEPASGFGANRVAESGDQTAHAEIVAMRDALTRHNLDSLDGHILLATGEPCGLCYRYALDHGVTRIHVAVDRDDVAEFGFDYRASYRAFGVTDTTRDRLYRHLPVPRGGEPFTRYLTLQHSPEPKGTSS